MDKMQMPTEKLPSTTSQYTEIGQFCTHLLASGKLEESTAYEYRLRVPKISRLYGEIVSHIHITRQGNVPRILIAVKKYLTVIAAIALDTWLPHVALILLTKRILTGDS